MAAIDNEEDKKRKRRMLAEDDYVRRKVENDIALENAKKVREARLKRSVEDPSFGVFRSEAIDAHEIVKNRTKRQGPGF